VRSVLLICLAVAAVVGVVAAGGAQATTQPGMLYVVRLVITDDTVAFRGDKFMTKSSIPHYPRGADVRYDVRNRGTHPFSLNILGSTTGIVRPGRERSILVYWSTRGRFVFRPQPSGPKIRVWVD
jgi:hypothetical protein